MADEWPAEELTSRRQLLESCSEQEALLLPIHFGAPHVAQIEDGPRAAVARFAIHADPGEVQIRLPHALPICSRPERAISFALVGAIAGEFVASQYRARLGDFDCLGHVPDPVGLCIVEPVRNHGSRLFYLVELVEARHNFSSYRQGLGDRFYDGEARRSPIRLRLLFGRIAQETAEARRRLKAPASLQTIRPRAAAPAPP